MQIARIVSENTIEVYDLTQFDTDAIMHSGQVFRYHTPSVSLPPLSRGEINCTYDLIVGQNKARLLTGKDKVVIATSNPQYFWNYFDLDTDYNEIKKQLRQYKTIDKVLNEFASADGIRILKGEFVETTISFIISANNNIKRFTKTLNLLSEQYGADNGFPTLEQLSKLTEEDFQRIGCGYRSPYLVKAIQQIKALESNKLQKLSNAELNKTLIQITGVGPKVSACVMLFCFHRLNTAPQDTWIIRALETIPEEDKEVLLNHRYAGVAQQYVFYYLQHLKKEL